MVNQEQVPEQVAKAILDIKEASQRLSYWQSVCDHSFKTECHYSGYGNEHDVTNTCQICGYVVYEY